MNMKSIFCFSMLLTAACQASLDTGHLDTVETNFDASVPDGGDAPVALCAADGKYQFNNNYSPYFGGEKSIDAEVVHFSSLYCPHCADFAVYTHNLWNNNASYSDSVRIYFHHLNSGFRHRAAVAAANQGMEYFWQLHDFIYQEMLTNGGPSDEDIVQFAETTLNLDMIKFTADLNSEETIEFLKWDYNQGASAGVVGTPTAFVCGNEVDDWRDLEDDVNKVL
jgi:protein-disulfide isomerase